MAVSTNGPSINFVRAEALYEDWREGGNIMKRFATFFLLWLGFVGCGACLADESSSNKPPADETYRVPVASDGIQRAGILGGNYFFQPKRVIVKVNVPVELELSLEKGVIPHSLVINAPEAGISVDEKLSTEVKKIRFTPTAVGTYPFYCKNKLLFFKSHREKGMEGMLEVVE